MLAAVQTWDYNQAVDENPLDGYTGTSGIEAIIFNPSDGELYGVDYHTLGTFDINSGEFFAYPDPIGWVNGSLGWIEVIDVDGLTYEAATGYLWASVRRESLNDLIIKLDTATGQAVTGAFGGDDYLVVQPLPNGADDIDDIALEPGTDTLYAVMNKRGQNDRIATIDIASGVSTDRGIMYCPEQEVLVEDMEGLGFGCDGLLWGVTGNKNENNPQINDALWEIVWDPIENRYDAICGRPLSYGSDYEGVTCGDLPVPAPSPIPAMIAGGDYDGDGTADPAVFRPSTGLWVFRGFGSSYFGKMGDVPVSGDFSGDGTDSPAYFRGSNGLWKIAGLTRFYFGQNGDVAVPADYDGDGTIDPAYFRDSAISWTIRGVTRVWFGRSGDIPIPADYDGDGTADKAIFRNADKLWIVRGLTRFYLGEAGDIPIALNQDGAPANPAVFRPDNGLWIIRGVTRIYFGQNGDWPIPGDYTGSGEDIPTIYRRYQSKWKLRGLTQFWLGRPGDEPVSR